MQEAMVPAMPPEKRLLLFDMNRQKGRKSLVEMYMGKHILSIH